MIQTRTLTHSDSGNRDADLATGAVANVAYAMTYDATDRLASVGNGGVTIGEYLHNALGQRVSKTVGVATTHYLYDLSGRLIAEADGATGATTSEYIAFEGINLAFITTGGIYWVHADHLGSPQMLTDATGTQAWSATYSPFGKTEETDPLALAFNPRFPGQYHDRETGYYYNYHRTYDPTSGRYVESDPIGFDGGWNTYAYVGGNPVGFLDPRGLRVLNPNGKPVTWKMLYALERLNSCLGCDKDIVITGGKRGVKSKTGSGSRSQHFLGDAADITVTGQTHLQTALEAQECGFKAIGWYQEGYYNPALNEGPHVHLDLRDDQTYLWGKAANGGKWNGRLPNPEETLVLQPNLVTRTALNPEPCPSCLGAP